MRRRHVGILRYLLSFVDPSSTQSRVNNIPQPHRGFPSTAVSQTHIDDPKSYLLTFGGEVFLGHGKSKKKILKKCITLPRRRVIWQPFRFVYNVQSRLSFYCSYSTAFVVIYIIYFLSYFFSKRTHRIIRIMHSR